MKLATILIALYKAGPYLEAKLETLRGLREFSDCEIVLLNCQDMDGESLTYRSFLDFPNVREIYYPGHVSLYKTWTDGIKATDSTFITNSNVDDMLHPEFVGKCATFLDENKEYGIVSTQVLVTDVHNQLWPDWKSHDRMPVLPYPESTAGPCPLWRRSLHEHGYFRDFRVIGDADMWETWYAKGVKFGLLKEDLALYYLNPLSLERRHDLNRGMLLRDLDLQERQS